MYCTDLFDHFTSSKLPILLNSPFLFSRIIYLKMVGKPPPPIIFYKLLRQSQKERSKSPLRIYLSKSGKGGVGSWHQVNAKFPVIIT